MTDDVATLSMNDQRIAEARNQARMLKRFWQGLGDLPIDIKKDLIRGYQKGLTSSSWEDFFEVDEDDDY